MTAAPRRTDPLAAALAFAIREAVRLEAERMPLPAAPSGAECGRHEAEARGPGGMTVRALPRSLEDLRGRRAARWIRESTAGQADNFGPDAQLEQQTRAIERWGLLDTGGAWQVAHSGRTIAATGQWAEMLAGAGEDWEVLVVGYVSRFARDLRTAVNARHDLHARGAVILFADERVLSSDEDEWERWAREAVEAEAYSRQAGEADPGGLRREAPTARRPGRQPGAVGHGPRGPDDDRRRGRHGRRPPRLRARGRRAHRPGGREGHGPRADARRRGARPTRTTLGASGPVSHPPSARWSMSGPGSTSR